MTKHFIIHTLRFSAAVLVSFVLVQLNTSCDNKDCQGCYKDAPFSHPDHTVCYPDKDMCTEELGVDCQRCI